MQLLKRLDGTWKQDSKRPSCSPQFGESPTLQTCAQRHPPWSLPMGKRVPAPGSPGKQHFYKYHLPRKEITFIAHRIFKQKISILSRRQTKLGEFN